MGEADGRKRRLIMASKESSKKVRARAPLRLGLGGGGTDVSPFSDEFGGYVLNVTIGKYAHVTITPRDDGLVELVAADRELSWNGPATETLPLIKGLELHTGVYNRVLKEFGPRDPLSLTIATHSEAPPGSGLGSSSTMVVALIQAFREYLTLPLGEYDIARLAYEIERVDLGMAGGKQDQYAAAFGGLNFMDVVGAVAGRPQGALQFHLVVAHGSHVSAEGGARWKAGSQRRDRNCHRQHDSHFHGVGTNLGWGS